MKTVLYACVTIVALGLGARPAPAQAAAFVVPPVPAGTYSADMAHTSVNFRVDHMGLSHYTARFTRLDASLQFDRARPEASVLKVSIDPRSVQTNYPEPQKLDFDAKVAGLFLAPDQFPKITFQSTKVALTGANTARVTGDLTLHGVTRPVVMDVTFNGGYPPMSFDPSGARIGFSAHASFKRSDFGITAGLPAPGTTMGVGDLIDVAIESELTKK
jgi:polyisoprenoid-binding protein YceI